MIDWSDFVQPEILSSLFQWITTGAVALGMIFWNRHKSKTEGAPWKLDHKNGEYWELTRLHDVKAKITRLNIGMCDTASVINNAAFPASIMSNGDSIMLHIRAELSGPFYLDYVEGKFRRESNNDLWGKHLEKQKTWSTGVWSTRAY